MQAFTARQVQIALFILLSLLISQALFGTEINIVVEPGTDSVDINVGGVIVASYEDPLYGVLTPVAHGFTYQPNDEFWDVGHDVVMVEVSTRGGAEERRYILAAGGLSLANNAVYAMQSQGPGIFHQPWVSEYVATVPGEANTNAYEMLVDPDNGFFPNLSIDDQNDAGHQQTSEHVVNVTVDDLDLNKVPLETIDTVVFYRIQQGINIIAEIEARYNNSHNVWQVRPRRGNGTSNLQYTDVAPGLYEVKLVRYALPGQSGANFYIDDHFVGALTGLPGLSVAPITASVIAEQTPEYDGLIMRFENPLVVTGTTLVDTGSRLASSDFGSDINGIQSVNTWDVIEGQSYMSFSPQTLAGSGQQLDIDMGAIPHWEHAYLREDFVSDPLSKYKARFWMDPTALNMPEGGSVRVVYGCRNSAASWCVDFRLGLTKVNGQLELNLYTWEDNGTMHTINYPISNAPQWIEIQYETSAAAAVATGWAELWVGGVSAGRAQNLANYNSKLEDVRFGTNYTAVQVTGTLSLDEIYSWSF